MPRQIALIIKFPPPTITAAQTDAAGKPAGHFDQAMRSLMWNGDAGDAGGGFSGGGFVGFGAADRATAVAGSGLWPPGLGPALGDGRGYVPPSLSPGPDGPGLGGSGGRV